MTTSEDEGQTQTSVQTEENTNNTNPSTSTGARSGRRSATRKWAASPGTDRRPWAVRTDSTPDLASASLDRIAEKYRSDHSRSVSMVVRRCCVSPDTVLKIAW